MTKRSAAAVRLAQLLAATSLASCWGSAALAQAAGEAATPTPGANQAANAPGANTQIEEIVVTAQKRSENLQKASVAIDAVRPEQIQRQGMHNAFDLQQIIPAVKFATADVTTASIRGLGTTNENIGVDSAVAYSEDGIYLAHPLALTPLLFDMQRVEVVLGPQGTLYGRNSNAGVINFITQDPSFSFNGFVSAGAGNYSAWNTEGAVNIPLSDKFAVRIAAGSENHGPYDANGQNDLAAYAGRIKLRYQPTSDLDVILSLEAAKRRSHGTQYDAECPPGANSPGCAGTAFQPWNGIGPFNPNITNRSDIFGAGLRVTDDLGWAQLTSLTGYRRYTYEGVNGAPWYTGADQFDFPHTEDDRFFTQEVRLASNAGSPITWVTGLYYSNETQLGTQEFLYHQDTLVQLGGGPANFYQTFPITSSLNQSEAIFGDVTIPIFTPTIRFRGGLRYTHETKKQSGYVESGIIDVGPLAHLDTRARSELYRLTWKAGLDWDVTSRNLLYVTASTGFKSGGVNNLPAEAASLLTYAPEFITAVELGSKNRFLDDRLQLNLSLFHYNYRNYQTFVFWNLPTTADVPSTLRGATLFPTVNSQQATFEGGEVNAIWRVTEADTLSAGLNILHDTFDTFLINLPYLTPINFSGTEAPLAPRSQVTVGWTHTFHLANGDDLSLDANSQIVSSQIASGTYTDAAGLAERYRVPRYHRTGLNVSYKANGLGLTVTAFARNLENAAVVNVVSDGFPVLQNFNKVDTYIDQPRTYGFTVRKDF